MSKSSTEEPRPATAGERLALGTASIHRASTYRFLAMLLLLTPTIGGAKVLASYNPAPPQIEATVIETPRTVYVSVPVPVPTVVIVTVPAAVASQPTAVPAENRASAEAPVIEVAEAVDPNATAPAEAAEEVAQAEEEAPPAPVAQVAPIRRVVNVPAVRPRPAVVEEAPAPETQPQVAQAPVEDSEPEVAEAPPPAPVNVPAETARQALESFYAFTENNWSVQGFSSADDMRDTLGNSQSGWFEQTKALAAEAPAAAPAKEEAPTDSASLSQSEEPAAETAALAPATASAPRHQPIPQTTEPPQSAPAEQVAVAPANVEPETAEIETVPGGEAQAMLSTVPAESEEPAIAPAAPQVSAETAAARQAIAKFMDYTENNWSVQGFSSAEEMREAVGNGDNDWLNKTKAAANQEAAEKRSKNKR